MIFKKCPNCEFENPDTAKFCNECGARLTPGESARSPQEQPPAEATAAAPVEPTPIEPTPPESVPAPAEASSEPAEPKSVAPPAAPVLLEPAPAPKELLAPPQETPLLAAVEALAPEKDQIAGPESPSESAPPTAEAAPEPASPPESTEIAAAPPSEPAIQLLEVSDPLVSEPKAAPQEQPVEAPAAGHPFGERFKIVEELGTGMLGTVYRVNDKAMEREMALKSIKPEISHKAEVFEGFGQELKVERGLVHKNIARIFELIPGPGTPFITMEYVAGRDLKSILKEKKRLPVAEVLPIAKQLFSGLAEAHKAGTLHLDLRPDNIIMDKEGTVKIMDLGILRLFRSKGVIRAVSGMPQYMSPEQIEGREADARSDIFAAGAILYEMLTGSLPPVGTAPRNPREINPEIPRELSRLILRCLEPEKDKRNATAREIRAELEEIESAAAQSAAGPALSAEPTKSAEPRKAAEAAARERAAAEQAAQSVQPRTKARRGGAFRRSNRSFIPTLAILGVVLLAAVLWQVVLKPSKKEPALPPTPTRMSLAVLPLEDASASKERQPLGV
ncbi:MAG: hypothetical protein H6P98_562, partial [Candidatus Aminicenantes bacterium]|nr:hypothetical protein [Candidatus Aminicenantes bacterium]